MPYDIVFSDIEGALRVDATGKRNIDDSIDFWTQVGERSAARNQSHILIVFNMRGKLSVTDIYSMASDHAQFNLTPAHRIAVAELDKDYFESMEFGTVVANNRGLRIRVFTSEPEAIEWLHSA